jgi:hypothetical protein
LFNHLVSQLIQAEWSFSQFNVIFIVLFFSYQVDGNREPLQEKIK